MESGRALLADIAVNLKLWDFQRLDCWVRVLCWRKIHDESRQTYEQVIARLKAYGVQSAVH
ncbi:hypothetical protein [Orrella sp. 11846]|uniref:hypothetical protein n=1 Tax=Orrella sp. 11846 TaxID=3409913 RepID=UPI003B5BE571